MSISCYLSGFPLLCLPTYAPFVLRSSVRTQVLAIAGSATSHGLYWIEVITRDMPAYNCYDESVVLLSHTMIHIVKSNIAPLITYW